jgi:PAS domain S-box-containing protein
MGATLKTAEHMLGMPDPDAATRNGRGPSSQLHERLFEALPTAVSVADPASSQLLSVNTAFTNLIGYAEHEVLGLTPPFPWWVSVSEDLAGSLGPGESSRRLEALFRKKDGQLVPVELVRLKLCDSSGAAMAEVHLGTDLSERRQFEQQLLQSGKLAVIGELAAGVAHEINNPLFAILGLVEFLLKEAEPGTKQHERLSLIQQTGLEIKEIVKALLDFARERSDEQGVVSLQGVIAQTVELMRRTSAAKTIEIEEVYCDETTLVNASPNQLKQIFLNLLTNAQQAMPDGGRVKIELAREGDWVQASVVDGGPGIPQAIRHRIFEPFFTTKRPMGGTGLGLSVSLGIAQMHGGDIIARSEPGSGATFTLRLPAFREPS